MVRNVKCEIGEEADLRNSPKQNEDGSVQSGHLNVKWKSERQKITDKQLYRPASHFLHCSCLHSGQQQVVVLFKFGSTVNDYTSSNRLYWTTGTGFLKTKTIFKATEAKSSRRCKFFWNGKQVNAKAIRTERPGLQSAVSTWQRPDLLSLSSTSPPSLPAVERAGDQSGVRVIANCLCVYLRLLAASISLSVTLNWIAPFATQPVFFVEESGGGPGVGDCNSCSLVHLPDPSSRPTELATCGFVCTRQLAVACLSASYT